MDTTGRPTIHWTEVPELPPDHELYREYQVFRREMPRLLAEGHEGKFVLIKGDTLIGLYPTFNDACKAGYERFLLQGFLVHQIRTWEPLLRLSSRCRKWLT